VNTDALDLPLILGEDGCKLKVAYMWINGQMSLHPGTQRSREQQHQGIEQDSAKDAVHALFRFFVDGFNVSQVTAVVSVAAVSKFVRSWDGWPARGGPV
jgi:hypothetical protein